MKDLKRTVIEMIDHLDREQLLELHQFLDQLQDLPENPAPGLRLDQEERKLAQ